MTQYQQGGRRRIDRVLAPGFADGLDALDADQLASRHLEAEQEEADLSYVRRLLQGRLDLLRSEAARRADGTPSTGPRTDAELAQELRRVLTDTGAGPAKPHYTNVQPTRVGEHRREVEAIVADVELSDAPHLDDARLGEAMERLESLERRVSESRRQVQHVLDRLAAEVDLRVERGTIAADSL